MQSKSSSRGVPDLPREACDYFAVRLEELPLEVRQGRLWPASWVWAPDPQTDPPSAYFAALDFVDERPWLVRGRIEVQGGLGRVRQLTVEPWEHDLEVTGVVLRRIGVADLRDRALAHMRDRVRIEEALPGLRELLRPAAPLRPFVAEATARRPRGRRGRTDAHYRDIAIAYLEVYESGVSRGILDELAARYGRPRETIRDWVRRARELGFLTTGTQGRAGAEPGPRLLSERDAKGGSDG